MFLEIHHASVRGIAAKDYPADVLDDWAPLPITQRAVESVRENPDNEIRVMAELDGQAVGLGAVVVAAAELRACYVLPSVARQGVGRAIVMELERIATEQGLTYLDLVASLTAERFYQCLGYRAIEHRQHRFGSGGEMACIAMRKEFAPVIRSTER